MDEDIVAIVIAIAYAQGQAERDEEERKRSGTQRDGASTSERECYMTICRTGEPLEAVQNIFCTWDVPLLTFRGQRGGRFGL